MRGCGPATDGLSWLQFHDIPALLKALIFRALK